MGRTEEALAAYERYVSLREQVRRGELPWSAIAEEMFTEDAVFIDPAWGRVEGRKAIIEFMDESMAGLDDWVFPEGWTMADGDRVVSFWWNRVAGTRDDGSPFQAPGVSILHYAGEGRFSYELDILNMTEVGEIMRDSGWKPTGEFNMPPREPNRDVTPQAGWEGGP